MAVNPGGYGEHRSAQVRRVLYISIIVIVVAVVAIAGFILKRSRGGMQEAAPEPQANTTEQGQPAAPVAMDANGSVVSAQIAQAMELLNQPTPKIIEARDRLNELLPLAQGQELLFIKGKLAELSDKWLLQWLPVRRLVRPARTSCLCNNRPASRCRRK